MSKDIKLEINGIRLLNALIITAKKLYVLFQPVKLTERRESYMSKNYPDDYPKTMFEALKAVQDIRDEDIDYSDIPPIGHKFIEMARRNLARMNAEKAAAL